MSKGLIGKKLGMTSTFTPEGKYIPVTVVKAGPCVVTQIKTKAVDGYNALQVGFGEKKASHTNRPQKGHFAPCGGDCFAHMREFPVENPDAFSLGQQLPLDIFKIGDRINVTGLSKGRGFSGVIKRHGFHGGRMTHGSKSKRVPGSVGCSAWPGKVIRGKRMPGHYGMEKKTIRNLEIVDIRPDENLILIKGALPGYKTGIVTINKPKFE